MGHSGFNRFWQLTELYPSWISGVNLKNITTCFTIVDKLTFHRETMLHLLALRPPLKKVA